MDYNPYQIPASSDVAPLPQVGNSEAVAIRTAHIHTEASIKGIAWLMIIGGALMIFGMVMIALRGNVGMQEIVVMLGFFGTAIVINLAVGFGLKMFKQWARIASIVLSSISLLFGIVSLLGGPKALPAALIASAVNLYVIILLSGSKASMVFSLPYREIIARTPEVRYKSNLLKVVLIMVLAFVVIVGVGIALVVASGSH